MSGNVEALRSTTGKVVKDGSLKPSEIDKLDPLQRAWSDKVVRALGLSSAGSQGRLIAGAVASAEEIETKGTIEDKATAKRLRADVLAAGMPPWKDTRKALAAGSAKAHLDILSIPAGQRELQKLGGERTANETFIIQRNDASGTKQRAFLCKPATGGDDPMPSGGPAGGEVAREALASRAAQLLASQTGIDIGMPETHVVQLSSGLVPDRANDKPVTCSVQEFRSVAGDMQSATLERKRAAPAEQVAALSIFDTLTLNTDRHGGNILVDAQGNLVPIDQGESFAERNKDGLKRMKATLGGPHNALLGLPGAHEPFSQSMLKKLKGLSADKFADGLASDQKAIGRANPDMADKVSPGAIENARRSAAFVKLAVSNRPPLNPAAIQTVMGAGAEELFSPATNDKEFQALAKRLIARMAPAQAVLKEVQTSLNDEYGALAAKLSALGWTLAERSGAPNDQAITDPLVALSLIKNAVRRPRDRAAAATLLDDLREGKGPAASLDEALEEVIKLRREVVLSMIPLAPAANAAKYTKALALVADRSTQDRINAFESMLRGVTKEAIVEQTARLAAFDATHQATELVRRQIVSGYKGMQAYNKAKDCLHTGRLIDCGAAMTIADTQAASGDFLPASARLVGKNLRTLADSLMLKTDPDLTAGLTAVGANDPITAHDRQLALAARAKTGTVGDRAIDQLQKEYDGLVARYTIDPSTPQVVEFQAAMADRDVQQATELLTQLKSFGASGRVLPTEAEFRKIVALLGVPDTDVGLAAVTTAFQSGNLLAFSAALLELEKPHKPRAAMQVQTDLDELLRQYTIPDQQTDLVAAREAMQNRPLLARFSVERLRSLATAGLFT